MGGGAAGWVETDEESDEVRPLGDGSFAVDASASVKELNTRMAWQLPELPDYNTLAGLILARLGRIPVHGEELAVGGLLIRIDKVADRRVVRVTARQARTGAPVVSVGTDAQSSTSPKKK